MSRDVPFRRQVGGMPDLDQGGGWTAAQWRKAAVRSVRLTSLIATNRGNYLDEAKVRKHSGEWFQAKPCVVEHRGSLYVADGHHRCVAAWRSGASHIRARVIRV